MLFFYHEWLFRLEVIEVRPDAEIGIDLPPEYCRYQDEGCELADSCLNCPFPKCIFDEPRGRQYLIKNERGKQIIRLLKEGKGEKELAAIFNISRRTFLKKIRTRLDTAGHR